MLELQRNFRSLLRKHAILKGIDKLRLFSDADEEVRLRNQPQRVQSALYTQSPQRSEIDMRRNVLFAGSFIRRTCSPCVVDST